MKRHNIKKRRIIRTPTSSWIASNNRTRLSNRLIKRTKLKHAAATANRGENVSNKKSRWPLTLASMAKRSNSTQKELERHVSIFMWKPQQMRYPRLALFRATLVIVHATQHNLPFRCVRGVTPSWLEVILRFNSSFILSVELSVEKKCEM